MTLPDAYRDEPEENRHEPDVSKRSRGVALLLSFFGGVFGLHRFYVDKPRTAIAMLCTFGGMGVWYLYDLVLIAAGGFRDIVDLPFRQRGVAGGKYAPHPLRRASGPGGKQPHGQRAAPPRDVQRPG